MSIQIYHGKLEKPSKSDIKSPCDVESERLPAPAWRWWTVGRPAGGQARAQGPGGSPRTRLLTWKYFTTQQEKIFLKQKKTGPNAY